MDVKTYSTNQVCNANQDKSKTQFVTPTITTKVNKGTNRPKEVAQSLDGGVQKHPKDNSRATHNKK